MQRAHQTRALRHASIPCPVFCLSPSLSTSTPSVFRIYPPPPARAGKTDATKAGDTENTAGKTNTTKAGEFNDNKYEQVVYYGKIDKTKPLALEVKLTESDKGSRDTMKHISRAFSVAGTAASSLPAFGDAVGAVAKAGGSLANVFEDAMQDSVSPPLPFPRRCRRRRRRRRRRVSPVDCPPPAPRGHTRADTRG